MTVPRPMAPDAPATKQDLNDIAEAIMEEFNDLKGDVSKIKLLLVAVATEVGLDTTVIADILSED